MINRNWSRWIFASLSKHFKLQTNPLFFFMEGENRKTQNINDYLEFRINGPNIKKLNGYYRLDVAVNIIVVAKQNLTTVHTIHNNVGLTASAFWENIPIYKLGSDTAGVDDGSFLGCMAVVKKEGREVDVSHIGQINPDTTEMQAMVQALYTMLLEI